MTHERLARARSVLERAGIHEVLDAEGADGEIAVIRAPAERLPALREIAPELRALGFRYVTLDFAPAPPPDAPLKPVSK